MENQSLQSIVKILREADNFYPESSHRYDKKLAMAVDIAADLIEAMAAELVKRQVVYEQGGTTIVRLFVGDEGNT